MKSNLDWLSRVSQEAAENTAAITTDGVSTKLDEAANVAVDAEKQASTVADTVDHSVVLKDAVEPDDNADAAAATGEVTASTESDEAPDIKIELTGATPSKEDGDETDEPVVAETEAEAGSDDGAEGGDVDGGDAVPAEVSEASTSSDSAAEPVSEEAELPAIDPVLEIQQGTDAAVADAEQNPEDGTGVAVVSEEGFTGGLLGFLLGSTAGLIPGVSAGMGAATKAQRMKLQQDIQTIAKRIAKVRAGQIDDATKDGLKLPKQMKNVEWGQVIKGALLGTFFGPFYGAYAGSDLQNLNDQLAAKLRELEGVMEAAGVKPSAEDYGDEEVVGETGDLEPEMDPDSELVVSEEGFLGGLLGFVTGMATTLPVIGTAAHAGVKASRLKLQQDIEVISKRIAEVRRGDIEDATKNGISVPKSLKNPDWMEIAKGALLGTFFGPFYGARQGSEFQNLNAKLKAKIKELEGVMEAAGVKPSGEDFDEVDDAADEEMMEPVDAVAEDVENFGVMQNALEAYQELLAAEVTAGRAVSPALVRSIMIGLESFQEPELMSNIPSLEDFADPTGKYSVSNELADNIAGKARMVGQAVIEAVKRLWEQLLDMLAQLKHNVPALTESNKALSEALRSLKDSKGGKISVKGAERLFIGENFGGDAAANYSSLGKFAAKFMVAYPLQLTAVIANWEKSEERDAAALATAIGNGFLPQQWGLLDSTVAKVPAMDKYDAVFASPVLLGNGRIYAGKNDAPSSNGVSALSDVWKIEWVKDPVTVDVAATEVNLPSVANLGLIVKAIDDLIGQIPFMTDINSGNYRKARNKVEAMLKEGNVGDAGAGLVRSLTMPTGNLVGHVVNTVKVGQAFVKHCIAQHQGATA